MDFGVDQVVGWSNIGGVLKTPLLAAGTLPDQFFSAGSKRAEVAALQGVPTGYQGSEATLDGRDHSVNNC